MVDDILNMVSMPGDSSPAPAAAPAPAAGQVNGKWQVFFGAGDGVCYAFDAKPEKQDDLYILKKVWWYDGNPPEEPLDPELQEAIEEAEEEAPSP